jgi:hypothetical protein
MPPSTPAEAMPAAPLRQELRSAFDAVPDDVRRRWIELRELVLETAAQTERVDGVTESLKWGEPSFAVRSGTPIRLGWKPSSPGIVRLLVHCQTDLVARWRGLYGETLTFEGTRAIALPLVGKLPREELTHCIAMALTYKRR